MTTNETILHYDCPACRAASQQPCHELPKDAVHRERANYAIAAIILEAIGEELSVQEYLAS